MLGEDEVLKELARWLGKSVYRLDDEDKLDPDELKRILERLGTSNPCPPGCHVKVVHIHAAAAIPQLGGISFGPQDILAARCVKDDDGTPCRRKTSLGRKTSLVYVLDYEGLPPKSRRTRSRRSRR